MSKTSKGVYVLAVWVRSGVSQCLKLSETHLLPNACQLSCNTRCEAALVFINTIFLEIYIYITCDSFQKKNDLITP
jgi:hypothetical protein